MPVKVSTEGGPVKIGDRITSSSLPGVGMSAKDGSPPDGRAGASGGKAPEWVPTVGIALESFDENSGGEWADLTNQKAAQSATFGGSQNNPSSPNLTLDCSIANQHNLSSSTVDNPLSAGAAGNCAPETQVSSLGSDYPDPSTSSSYQSGGKMVKTGKILVFVNLGYSKLDTEIASAANGDLAMTNGWSVDQQSPQNLSGLTGRAGKVNVNFFGSITLATGGTYLNLNGNEIINVNKILGMDGKWSLDENGKLIVKEIETEKIKSQKGYTVPDEDTGALFCIKVKSGALVAAQGECGAVVPGETATSTP